MRVAISFNGVIQNIIEANSVSDAQAIFPDAEVFAASGVSIGWVFDGSGWVAPTPPAPPAPVTPSLTGRQLELGLLHIGVTASDIEAQINTIVDVSERAAALVEWRRAGSFERDHPLLVQIAAALNLPAQQVDDLWLWASAL